MFTVGERTAEEAREAGFQEVHSADGDVQALKALLAQNPSDKLYLYARATHISNPLKGQIEGVEIDEKILYHIDKKGKFCV